MATAGKVPAWSWVFPILGLLFYAAVTVLGIDPALRLSATSLLLIGLLAPILIGTVFAAVHHAETVAAAVGEPFGTLVLTVAVTVIELALIVSVMLTGTSNPELARDTVYAVVMIVCNGLVGLCILAGGLRFREQSFDVTGASIYLAVLIVLATLTLILPNFTRALPGPVYSSSQLVFISLATIALYGVFLFTQTVLHRNYFVPSTQLAVAPANAGQDVGGNASRSHLLLSGIALVLALIAVVLLAKSFAASMHEGLIGLGAPAAVTGVLIALLILMPEAMAALQAAQRNELQKSLNLALGSSLATIGLTIPAVASVNLLLQEQLVLGLEAKEMTLLFMTFSASILTLSTGKTNILFGFLHLVIFGTFLFLSFVP
jgi:Ca2+:H+ antiporter